MQEFGYTEVIMNQRNIVPFGTEADKVDSSSIGISIGNNSSWWRKPVPFSIKIQQFGSRFDSTSE